MRLKPLVLSFSILAAFAAGVVVSPALHELFPDAHAQVPAPAASPTPLLTPAVIDLAAMKHGDLPTSSNPEMNTKMLVTTASGTLQIQSGNVAKHMHPNTDEIQYILDGSGAMWLGNERKEFKPGTLIVIPKGTAHGGTLVKEGPVKALAIKLPPQAPTDTVFLKD